MQHGQAQHIVGSQANETRTNSFFYYHHFSNRVVETFYLNCKENYLYVDNNRQMEGEERKNINFIKEKCQTNETIKQTRESK